MTLASRKEHSFLIFQSEGDFSAGHLWTGWTRPNGSAGTDTREWYEYLATAEPVVANYHTHPTLRPSDAYTDTWDLFSSGIRARSDLFRPTMVCSWDGVATLIR